MESQPSPEQQQEQSGETKPKGVVVTYGSAPADGVRVFNEGAVALASLIGTPVAGGVVLLLNGLKLKRPWAAVVGLVMGVVLTYSLLGMVNFTAQYVSPWMLLVVGAGIMWWVTGMLQGEYIKGRPRGPLGVAVLVGVVVAGGLYFGLWPILQKRAAEAAQAAAAAKGEAGGQRGIKGKVATFGEKQAVMYVDGVSEEQVKKVGAALTQVGYFDKTGQVEHSVLMSRDAAEGHLIVLFPVPEGQEKNEAVLKGFAIIARQFVIDEVELPFVVRLVTPDLKKMLGNIKVDKAATRPTTTVAP